MFTILNYLLIPPHCMDIQEKLVNLTTNDVVLFPSINREEKKVFKASDYVARLVPVEQDKKPILSAKWDLPIYSPQEFEGVKNLPHNKSTSIIVSEPIARFMHEENMEWKGLVVFPDTSPDSIVRGIKGEVLGVRRFCSYQ
jgi:hypothetical protein